LVVGEVYPTTDSDSAYIYIYIFIYQETIYYFQLKLKPGSIMKAIATRLNHFFL
jgi:hypothetical protein